MGFEALYNVYGVYIRLQVFFFLVFIFIQLFAVCSLFRLLLYQTNQLLVLTQHKFPITMKIKSGNYPGCARFSIQKVPNLDLSLPSKFLFWIVAKPQMSRLRVHTGLVRSGTQGLQLNKSQWLLTSSSILFTMKLTDI